MDRLEIDSLVALQRVEPEILRRVAEIPNGGLLLLTHPLRMLADVGVAFSRGGRTAFLSAVPWAAHASDAAYDGLRASPHDQSSTARIRQLLNWEEQ